MVFSFFEYRKPYAKLNIVYSLTISAIVKIIYPLLRKAIRLIESLNPYVLKIGAILKQEEIRRGCANVDII